MSTYGEGLYSPSLIITGCLFAPVYHYYAGIKWFLVPVYVSKDSNIVPALEAIGHKTEVVARLGENNGQLLAKN